MGLYVASDPLISECFHDTIILTDDCLSDYICKKEKTEKMIQKFTDELRHWAENNDQVESVILVGSYARGTYTDTSDLDVVLITPEKERMVREQNFPETFGPFIKKQTEFYGACTSIRVWYRNGLEVEFGLVEPSWIALPLDPGTRQVLSDGFWIILDKKGYFRKLPL